ncbi:hypothetical protein HAX54_038762 [Datura stramonium]|uniref:Uncharacterized protein n=1 Tax=Datura stramonium TaxID=4076 RepID=A0ABS8VLP0_DATST|nr:hypothetical protein [Datura stramonium]
MLRHSIMSTPLQGGKGKTPITNATTPGVESDEEKQIDQLLFGINKMKNYYVQFKENQSITVECRFEVDSFKDDFSNIYDQFQIRDWEPFVMPFDPYFPKLVREFYTSYRAQQDILKHKGRVDKMSCLSSVLIRGQEVPITPEEIKSIYWADPVNPSRDFKRKLDDKDDQFEWMAEIIALGQSH